MITLASGEKNLLDIIPSHELLQKGYPKKQLYVIGLAKGYDEAVEVAASVIDEVYRQTGAFEVASYLREKGGEKQNDRRVTHNLKNHWDCAAGDSWNHTFLLAVLLFVPVRYSVKGTVDNNITAEGKISWLCSIFRYDFTFQEQDLNGEVRIFGFRPKKKREYRKKSWRRKLFLK